MVEASLVKQLNVADQRKIKTCLLQKYGAGSAHTGDASAGRNTSESTISQVAADPSPRKKPKTTSKNDFLPREEQQLVHGRVTSAKYKGKTANVYVNTTAEFAAAIPAATIEDVMGATRVFLTSLESIVARSRLNLSKDVSALVFRVNNVLEDYRGAAAENRDLRQIKLHRSSDVRLLHDLMFVKLHHQVDDAELKVAVLISFGGKNTPAQRQSTFQREGKKHLGKIAKEVVRQLPLQLHPAAERVLANDSAGDTLRQADAPTAGYDEQWTDLQDTLSQQFAGRSSEFLRARLAAVAEVVETRPDGQRHVDLPLVSLHDQVTVVEYLQSGEVAARYLRVPAVAVSQTALNVPVGLRGQGHLSANARCGGGLPYHLDRASVETIWGLRNDSAALVQPRRPYPPKKTRLSAKEVGERVAAVPLCQWQTLRALEAASGIPRSTLHRHLKSKVLRRFISRVKPTLTDGHKLQRLTWALAHVQRPIGGLLYRFNAMYDIVHIDEKWFNMYKASSRYYLASDEALPYRSCSNKRYIGKVMFLAAVARPRYDFSRKKYFDGKIGIWPIVERTAAKRTSKNRVVGTLITENITMSRKIYVQMLKEKVFPAIRAKWPGRKTSVIRVQQDNAGPHVEEDHGEVLAAGKEGGWDIQMLCQSPRSPECNILDLGIF
ncbi:hypothetical protein ON010_g12300 [Phytophthora cinnamomi]|nr:hypothetical protein ON010_g12300 [Phytophthora cinnamomi]